MTTEELTRFTSAFFAQFERALQRDRSFREELLMKPKCLACHEELTRKNRDRRWKNFCALCAQNCTELELLSMENESKRLK